MFIIEECKTIFSLENFIAGTLRSFLRDHPYLKEEVVLLKPNFNSDMIALTGNTSDLRLIIAIIKELKLQGFKHIVIGDGTSSGFLNAGIDVLTRLGVNNLAYAYGCEVVDFNNCENEEVIIRGIRIRVPKICLSAGFFINIPKLKTHAETGLSLCLKNMMGCVYGSDKQKIHRSLGKGIYELNKVIKPRLHIIDGLISMEGTGPSRGIPRLTNIIAAGDDPFEIDSFFASIVGFKPQDIPYLSGYNNPTDSSGAFLPGGPGPLDFIKPKPAFWFKFINFYFCRPFFVWLRYLPVLRGVLSSDKLSPLLFYLGIRQDFFIKETEGVSEISVDKKLCTNCRICLKYCPMELDIPQKQKLFPGCIKCFYCYFICPVGAIEIKGKLGHLCYQIENYKRLIAERVTSYEDMPSDRLSS